MTAPFATPRRFRPWGAVCIGLFVGLLALLLLVIPRLLPEKYPGQNAIPRWAWVFSIGAAAVSLFSSWYSWGFGLWLDAVGIYAGTRWPFKTTFVPWAELSRVDFFRQQRRMGLLKVAPSNLGIPFGVISGFRFWGREGKPVVFGGEGYTYLKDPAILTDVLNGIVAPSLRKAGKGRLILRQGRAASETPFRGELVRTMEDVSDVSFVDGRLDLVLGNGVREAVPFPGSPAVPDADLVLIELAWGRPLDVGKMESA